MTININDPVDPAAERAQLQQEVYIATRISDLLNDPAVADALNGMLHGFQNSWLDSVDPKERDLLWIKAQGLKEFLNTLQSLITTGKMAAAQLESMKNDSTEEE